MLPRAQACRRILNLAERKTLFVVLALALAWLGLTVLFEEGVFYGSL